MMRTKSETDEDLIKDTKIFHFGTLSMTADGVREATQFAVELAKKSGAIISFDPNYRAPLWSSEEAAKDAIWWGIGPCDILKISDNEIEFITGKQDIDEGIAAIKEQAGHDIKLICASMGPDGSKAFYGDMTVSQKPFLREDTIETTGAGDTFMACVLNEVCEGGIESFDEKRLSSMLTFANAAASIITTRKGALKVMPTREEVEEVIK